MDFFRRGRHDDDRRGNEDSPRRRSGSSSPDSPGGRGNSLSGPTYRLYCKAGGQFSVAVRENKVVLVYSDDHHDTQHWYKDERFASKARDDNGNPSFALVNKATGQVIRHSVVGEPVTLSQYDPNHGLDLSILWTESHDVGEGFKNIRPVNDTRMCMDAFHGDKDHGGCKDGTQIAIYECWNGENQKWKIVPYSNSFQDQTKESNLGTSELRQTLEQVIREIDEKSKREECHHAEAWEIVESRTLGEQTDPYNVNSSNRGVLQQRNRFTSMGSMVSLEDNSDQLEQQVRKRLGKTVSSFTLGRKSECPIFIPQWEITTDDCLTDAFSERSTALCHQWCKEIVPPKDCKELLCLGLNELYQWADYHKAQAHIFEMTAREKASILFSNEQALREAAEKCCNKNVTDNVTGDKVEEVEKLMKEKSDLIHQLQNLEKKCSQLKEQANSFEIQFEELKKASQMNCEEQERSFKNSNLYVGLLLEDLKERSSKLTVPRKKTAALEARYEQMLEKKMEIVVKAIRKRHRELDWGPIFDEIDKMNAKLDAENFANGDTLIIPMEE